MGERKTQGERGSNMTTTLTVPSFLGMPNEEDNIIMKESMDEICGSIRRKYRRGIYRRN